MSRKNGAAQMLAGLGQQVGEEEKGTNQRQAKVNKLRKDATPADDLPRVPKGVTVAASTEAAFAELQVQYIKTGRNKPTIGKLIDAGIACLLEVEGLTA